MTSLEIILIRGLHIASHKLQGAGRTGADEEQEDILCLTGTT